MRILSVINRFWPAVGGAESYLGEISARLAAEGHTVTVATTDSLDFDLLWNPRRRRVPERESVQAGVRILRFPVRHLPLAPASYIAWRFYLLRLLAASPGVPVALLRRLARFTPWVPDLWRWLNETGEAFDLVAGFTILYEPLVEAGQAFARRRGIPFVCCPFTHLGAGPQPGRDGVSRYYTMPHQSAMVVASDAVIAQTPAERAFYEGRGLPAGRAVVAGPGVNPAAILGGDGARFRQRHGIHAPIVTFLAAMTADKGATHLVEAVSRLWQSGLEVELVMAGTVTAPFQRFLDGLPEAARRRLRVLGPISEEEKRDLLAASDVVAMPSRTDSFGIIYLEAWLYRKPVVGARAWGMADVIAGGQDGVLVDYGDVPGLARALADLIAQPERRAAMGQAGERKVYAEHLWDQKYARVRALYEKVAGP